MVHARVGLMARELDSGSAFSCSHCSSVMKPVITIRFSTCVTPARCRHVDAPEREELYIRTNQERGDVMMIA